MRRLFLAHPFTRYVKTHNPHLKGYCLLLDIAGYQDDNIGHTSFAFGQVQTQVAENGSVILA